MESASAIIIILLATCVVGDFLAVSEASSSLYPVPPSATCVSVQPQIVQEFSSEHSSAVGDLDSECRYEFYVV